MPGSVSAGHLVVEATLRDGKELTGTIAADRFTFEGVTPEGEVVTVRIKKPPQWSKARWVCEIEWDSERNLFLLREIGWTGELVRLWTELAIDSGSGQRFVVKGSQIKRIRFGYVKEPAKAGTNR